MAAIRINGVIYDGAGGNPRPPSSIELTIKKISRTLVNANGGRTLVIRASGGVPIRKRTWAITWEKVESTTRDAVRAVLEIATTFTYRDEEGTAYTVNAEGDDDYTHGPSWTNADGSLLYDVSIVLREA